MDPEPREGYVNAVRNVCGMAKQLAGCEVPGHEPVKRDVSPEVKKAFTFKHFEAICMQNPASGTFGFVLLTRRGFLYDENIVKILLAKRTTYLDKSELAADTWCNYRHHVNWKAGDVARCCACYDPGDELVGVSICHPRDKYSKGEARYVAYSSHA